MRKRWYAIKRIAETEPSRRGWVKVRLECYVSRQSRQPLILPPEHEPMQLMPAAECELLEDILARATRNKSVDLLPRIRVTQQAEEPLRFSALNRGSVEW
jgi:hypothetical protein